MLRFRAVRKIFYMPIRFIIVEQVTDRSSEKETIKLSAEGKEVGYISFVVTENELEIRHTVVYPEFRGKGYGKTLVDSAINVAESRGLMVTSTCSYADKILGKK